MRALFLALRHAARRAAALAGEKTLRVRGALEGCSAAARALLAGDLRGYAVLGATDGAGRFKLFSFPVRALRALLRRCVGRPSEKAPAEVVQAATGTSTVLSDDEWAHVLSFVADVRTLPVLARVCCRSSRAMHTEVAWAGVDITVRAKALRRPSDVDRLIDLGRCWGQAKSVELAAARGRPRVVEALLAC